MSNIQPVETDWDRAPGVLEGAAELELTPEQCDLPYWLEHVAGTMLRRLSDGTVKDAGPSDLVRAPGPLRDAVIDEFAFRHLAEEKATRALGFLVHHAPDSACLEFFTTQLVDEARHARAFRDHLLTLGVPAEELARTVEEAAGQAAADVLDPLEEFGLTVLRDQGDFYGGVLVLTVLVEGVLAPAAELSERKWRRLDPGAALVERGANMDEIRHLAVGSAIVRQHLTEHPEERDRLLDVIRRGRDLWTSLPMERVLYRRETLFQEGLRDAAAFLGDYEVWEGRRLVDTTAEERMATAESWSAATQDTRLRYMLLDGAVG
ncbi:VlmB-like protein [Streptomyces roseicoloratus]|uniref:VlmB-like protein n=1 Tax=Streptomyces roseicoloratus TaxID=2508722 RepID=A0ABY9RRU2_9ACTN|nr:VlmB-like protein [Streptomyces roseicoloratus]WMX44206.1 VlmB-like protein [Streptomyces roseicoloratus]